MRPPPTMLPAGRPVGSDTVLGHSGAADGEVRRAERIDRGVTLTSLDLV